MIDENSIKAFITRSVDTLYKKLQQGSDVSPGERLRLEGQIDLMLGFDVIDSVWIQELINQRYQYFFNQPVDDVHWQWVAQDRCFYLPFKMQEAPVYKT